MKLNYLIFLIICSIWVSCNNAEENKVVENFKESNETTTKELSKELMKNILFFGNSLTAAYRLDPSDGFTSIIQNRIDSLRLSYKVINAGLSGETTAGGNGRIDWVIRQPIDVFVLELGANDALRGTELASSYQNLESIIEKVKGKYPDVKIVLAGMQAPPNMGDEYTKEFKEMYPKLAEKYNAALVPFLLEGVAADPELNLADGIHPNEKGQKILAENVWLILKDLL